VSIEFWKDGIYVFDLEKVMFSALKEGENGSQQHKKAYRCGNFGNVF
jgi:hypothetical protein